MSSKIEGVPDGWDVVRIGTPAAGETYLGYDLSTEVAVAGHTRKDFVIVRKIEPPKPVYVPWTYDTVPLGVHVECLDARKKGMITGAGDDGARIGATVYSYEKLLADWQLRSGTPCGTVEVTE